MTKVSIVSVVVKLYFIGALAGSFVHLVHSGHKLGLTYEAYAIPFMIDGIAVIGMVMRGEEFSKATRKMGFRTQLFAGALSLAGNVYAANTLGGILFGIGIVALYVIAEFLSGRIESRKSELAREAAIAAEAKKQAAIEKGRITKARNARKRKQEIKVLENMVSK